MIYRHVVKYNGKYYPAGTDVPNDKKEEVKEPEITAPSSAEVKEAKPKKKAGKSSKSKKE